MIFKLYVASMVAVSVSFGTTCYRSSNKIETEPVFYDNTLARNFNGLKLSIKFLFLGDSYIWHHSGFSLREIPIFSQFLPCANKSERDIQVTCKKVLCEGSTYIITSLTLMYPLDRDVTFSVKRVGKNVSLASIDIKVIGCSIGLGRQLEVVSQSSDYNTVGEFRCRNNGVLFYSNKTRLDSTKTKCLATAQWEDSDKVQCWTAPAKVSVVGNLTVTEGDNINLKCEYQSGFPIANGSFFFFDDTTTYVEESGIFTITKVHKANHNQSTFCQVQSPYVALVDQSSGRSQRRFINVLCMYRKRKIKRCNRINTFLEQKDQFFENYNSYIYPPYTTSLQQCTWKVNAVGICNVSFHSNPNAQGRSVLFSGTDITHSHDVNNVFISSTVQQYFVFIREQVGYDFTGFYELVLYSNGFGETKISFQIIVVDQLPTTQLPATFRPQQLLACSDSITIIGLSIGIVFSVISITLSIVNWRERYYLKE